MRVVGLDLGSKRVGVAASDATATLASPRTMVARSGDQAAEHRALVRLVVEEEAAVVVVGLPINMNGSRGPAARAAEDEAAALTTVLAPIGVRVEMVDERLSTVTADRALIARGKRAPARRLIVDQTAAAVLLQCWLDGPGGRALRARPGSAASVPDPLVPDPSIPDALRGVER